MAGLTSDSAVAGTWPPGDPPVVVVVVVVVVPSSSDFVTVVVTVGILGTDGGRRDCGRV